MCTLSVGNVIYHKFSQGAAFYMLNGKKVNVMSEYFLIHIIPFCIIQVCLCEPSYQTSVNTFKQDAILLKELGGGIHIIWTHFWFVPRLMQSSR